MLSFSVKFEFQSQKISVGFDSSEQSLSLRFEEVQQVTEKPDFYEGEYNITPKVEAQTIPTANKFLVEDVTVKEIPFFRVGNTAGGSTVYIANEV